MVLALNHVEIAEGILGRGDAPAVEKWRLLGTGMCNARPGLVRRREPEEKGGAEMEKLPWREASTK